MPLVDGFEATRLIRAYENESSHPVSPRSASYGRTPIIAVSASLSEQRISEYVEAGFDGWIVKPIDFKRLEDVLLAIYDEHIRYVFIFPCSCDAWGAGLLKHVLRAAWPSRMFLNTSDIESPASRLSKYLSNSHTDLPTENFFCTKTGDSAKVDGSQ